MPDEVEVALATRGINNFYGTSYPFEYVRDLDPVTRDFFLMVAVGATEATRPKG